MGRYYYYPVFGCRGKPYQYIAICHAQKEGEKIALEIKSFVKASNISEFHTAVRPYTGFADLMGRSPFPIPHSQGHGVPSCPYDLLNRLLKRETNVLTSGSFIQKTMTPKIAKPTTLDTASCISKFIKPSVPRNFWQS